jgi:hypothetical protein
MNNDEVEIMENFMAAHHLVIETKHAVTDAKRAHREAVKFAADADAAYRELVKKRLEVGYAAQ